MAFVPLKMDDAQIAFLANEITKAYMTGKNMGSMEEFAQDYYEMYQSTVNLLQEKQRERNMDIDAIIDNTALNNNMNSMNDVPVSKMFH